MQQPDTNVCTECGLPKAGCRACQYADQMCDDMNVNGESLEVTTERCPDCGDALGAGFEFCDRCRRAVGLPMGEG